MQNPDGWHAFQEFMIRERAKGPVTGVEFRGAETRRASRRRSARRCRRAELIVIGPSNPVISIGPILAVGEMRAEMRATRASWRCRRSSAARCSRARPTRSWQWAGHPLSSDGIAAHYAGLIDGLVADEQATEIPTLVTDVEMGDPAARRRVAEAVLGFA